MAGPYLTLIKRSPLDLARLPVKWALFRILCGGDSARYHLLRGRLVHLASGLGLYERTFLKNIRRFLSPGDCALDVGANFGVYSKALSAAVGANGRVLAFEPLPETMRILKAMTADCGNIQYHELALSDREGDFDINIPLLFGGIPEPALASISPPALPHVSVRARVATLDSLPEIERRVSFIKADIEGEERRFFAGARDFIARHRPVIQFEDNSFEENEQFYLDFAKRLDLIVGGIGPGGALREWGRQKLIGYNFYLLPSERRGEFLA